MISANISYLESGDFLSIQPKYSVIIPVYNRETTLTRCIESLLSERREDVQILLVDDGSTDNSAKIATTYADKYPQIQYHYKTNGGVSSARNFGLDLAKGQYITFVDSDDFVSEDYFSVLDASMDGRDIDLLVFQKAGFGGMTTDESTWFQALSKLNAYSETIHFLLSSRLIINPVNKCFRNDYIQRNHLRFVEELHTGEDFVFCMMYAALCSNAIIETKTLYYYDVSDLNSLSRRYRPDLNVQMSTMYTSIQSTLHGSCFSDEDKEYLLGIVDFLYVKNVFSCISEEFKQKKLTYIKDRKQIAEICDTFRYPLSKQRINLIHRVLRLLLSWKIYYPFYLVSYWVKGRKYLH